MENINPLLKETFVFRPLDDIQRMQNKLNNLPNSIRYRYNGGNWIEDDGQPDLAFAEKNFAYYVELPSSANLVWYKREEKFHIYVWHYMTIDDKPWYNTNPFYAAKHPNYIAGRKVMDFVSGKYGCANGRSIDLTRDNEYIQAGLLKTLSGVIVKPPENFNCYLCANNNYGHNKQTLEKNMQDLKSRLKDCKDAIDKATNNIESNNKEIARIIEDLEECNEEMLSIEKERYESI